MKHIVTKKTSCQNNEMPLMCIVDNYIIDKQCSFLWNSFVHCCNLFCQYEIKKKKEKKILLTVLS